MVLLSNIKKIRIFQIIAYSLKPLEFKLKNVFCQKKNNYNKTLCLNCSLLLWGSLVAAIQLLQTSSRNSFVQIGTFSRNDGVSEPMIHVAMMRLVEAREKKSTTCH